MAQFFFTFPETRKKSKASQELRIFTLKRVKILSSGEAQDFSPKAQVFLPFPFRIDGFAYVSDVGLKCLLMNLKITNGAIIAVWLFGYCASKEIRNNDQAR